MEVLANTSLSLILPADFTLESLPSVIVEADNKLQLACHQLTLLNDQVNALRVRYQRAVDAGRRSFRYSLRMRLLSLESVRDVMYHYAMQLADDLDTLEEVADMEV